MFEAATEHLSKPTSVISARLSEQHRGERRPLGNDLNPLLQELTQALAA